MWKKLVIGAAISIFSIFSIYYITIYFLASDKQVLNIEQTNEQVIIDTQFVSAQSPILNAITSDSVESSSRIIKNCDNLSNTTKKVEKYYQNTVKTFHLFINSKGIPKVSEELIAQQGGISLDNYRRLSSPFKRDINTLMPIDGDVKDSVKYAVVLGKAMNNKNYQSIIDLLTSGDITNNSIFFDKSILSSIIINDKEISTLELERLMNAGLTLVLLILLP